MHILKRIKRDFNKMLLKATSLVAIGAFLFSTVYVDLVCANSLRPVAMAERQRVIEDVSNWDTVMTGDIVRLRRGNSVKDFAIIQLRSPSKRVKFAQVVGGSKKKFALKVSIGGKADVEARCFESF